MYSNDNVLRAYFLRPLQRVVLPEGYQFSVPAQTKGDGQRAGTACSTMAYPTTSTTGENPFSALEARARWAGFRHRMDALYARDFILSNISDKRWTRSRNCSGR